MSGQLLDQVATQPIGSGRMLLVRPGGACYLGRGHSVYRSNDDGASWTRVAVIPQSVLRRTAGVSRLASRLLRYELRALAELSDGTLIAANRQGVFRSVAGAEVMIPAQFEGAGQSVSPPMTLTVGPRDRILWGEYSTKTAHAPPVRLFVSDKGGATFQVARVFEGGSIRHVHNIQFDEQLRHYWVLAGDHDHEPGIGRLSEDLKDFDWVAKGQQQYRAVQVFDLGDSLIYGTDTEREKNAVIRLEKKTGRVERLQELDGSCIYGCRFGGIYALSTSIEPSLVNLGREAGLWLSRDAMHWTRVFGAAKDRWHAAYFQFGSIVLPRGETDRETILFSGQALRGIDGRAFRATAALEHKPGDRSIAS
ncbi:MAG TPA: sialidase family protein [Phycisphaerae bacterium]|nr:sialidase family protein [Phycisphaerae bacterium]